MSRPRRSPPPRRYAELAHLLDGYFHQDFALEHGEARAAARAFVRDAAPHERARAAAELAQFLRSAGGADGDDWRGRLAQIGGAWHPRSLDDLRAILVILEASETDHGQ